MCLSGSFVNAVCRQCRLRGEAGTRVAQSVERADDDEDEPCLVFFGPLRTSTVLSRTSGATSSRTLPRALLRGFPKPLRFAMSHAPCRLWRTVKAAPARPGSWGRAGTGATQGRREGSGGRRTGRLGRPRGGGGGRGRGELELGQLVDLGGQLGQGGLQLGDPGSGRRLRAALVVVDDVLHGVPGVVLEVLGPVEDVVDEVLGVVDDVFDEAGEGVLALRHALSSVGRYASRKMRLMITRCVTDVKPGRYSVASGHGRRVRGGRRDRGAAGGVLLRRRRPRALDGVGPRPRPRRRARAGRRRAA